MRIGYLVGQFPMPTHTFFWRDVRALEAAGVEVDLVSTRLPSSQLAPHAWAPAAIARTTYLTDHPLRIAGAFTAAALRSPRGLARCLAVLREVESPGALHRARVAALIPVAARLAALARRRGWCHLHVPFPADAAFLALFAHQLDGLPYSLGHHCNPAMFGPGVSLAAKWRCASFGTAITGLLRDELRTALGAACPEPLLVAPMGVELSTFTRANAYRPWAGAGPARLFTCARVVPDKGHLDAVEAVALLARRGFPVELRIAGEAPEGAWFTLRLRERIRELGLEPRVVLLGAIPEAQVLRELEQTHAFVLATHDEGLGVVIMEAMAMQVPAISTTVGGVPELITDGVEGRLVPPRDPAALAEAIAGVLANPAEAERLGAAGRVKVAARFTAERGANVLLEELRRRYAARAIPGASSAGAPAPGR